MEAYRTNIQCGGRRPHPETQVKLKGETVCTSYVRKSVFYVFHVKQETLPFCAYTH